MKHMWVLSFALALVAVTSSCAAHTFPFACQTALEAAANTTARDHGEIFSRLDPNIHAVFGGQSYSTAAQVVPLFLELYATYPGLRVEITASAPLAGRQGEQGACLVKLDLATLDIHDSYARTSYLVEFGVLPSGNISRWLEYPPQAPTLRSRKTAGCNVTKPVDGFLAGWKALDVDAVGALLAPNVSITQGDQVFTRTSYLAFASKVMDMFASYGLESEDLIEADNNVVTLVAHAWGTSKGQGPNNAFVTRTLVSVHVAPDTCLIDGMALGNVVLF